MLCTDFLPIMIVLSGMALTLGFPTENVHEKRLLGLVKDRDSQLPKEYRSCPLCRSWNTRHKNKTHRYLEPIIVKLEVVYGKYEEKKKDLEKFYPEYNHLKPPRRNRKITQRKVHNERSNSFGCLNIRELKTKISHLRKKIERIEKNLRYLIRLEKSPDLKKNDVDEGRLKLLKEFLAELKNLNVELNHMKKTEKTKRNKSLTRQTPKKAASANLSHIKSEIGLTIEEWKVLDNLKIVLEKWRKKLRNFFECKHIRQTKDVC